MQEGLSFAQRDSFFQSVAAKCADMGGRVLLTPELSFCGYTSPSKAAEESNEAAATLFFSSLSKKFSIDIGFGYISKDRDGYKNSYAVISKDGEMLCRYDKIHTFSHSTVEAEFVGGDNPVVVEIDGLKIGIAVCYDLRFAELFLYYAKKCDAIIVPSAWPKSRIFEFKSLLCARAIESRCEIFAPNYINGGFAKKGAFAYRPTGREKRAVKKDGALSFFEPKTDGSALLDIQKDRKKELYKRLLWL